MNSTRACAYWKRFGNTATAILLSGLLVPLAAGCGSREVEVEDEASTPESEQMLDYQKQIFDAQIQQQNQPAQEQAPQE